ncbi:MAG: hypothetical protein ACJ72E_09635 [Marmoricola sp.]
MPNPLQEALARLIAESDAAEKILASRVSSEDGAAALTPLFGVASADAPVREETGSSGPDEIDWTAVDAQVSAQHSTTESSPPDPEAASASSVPAADAALLALLNPEG